MGSFVLSSGYYDAYYLKALRTKALIKKAFDERFSARYDLILAPAAPTTAPKLGESLSVIRSRCIWEISIPISVNLAGLPAHQLFPAGPTAQGLPVGMQLIGDCFQ